MFLCILIWWQNLITWACWGPERSTEFKPHQPVSVVEAWEDFPFWTSKDHRLLSRFQLRLSCDLLTLARRSFGCQLLNFTSMTPGRHWLAFAGHCRPSRPLIGSCRQQCTERLWLACVISFGHVRVGLSLHVLWQTLPTLLVVWFRVNSHEVLTYFQNIHHHCQYVTCAPIFFELITSL